MVAVAGRRVVAIGKENAGKSRLLWSLTGIPAYVASLGGSTVACESYPSGPDTFIDTPGIFLRSDAETTRAALREVDSADVVLLVVPATHLDQDMAELASLATGCRTVIVVTWWDRIEPSWGATRALERLRQSLGVPVVPVDARRLLESDRAAVHSAIAEAAPMPDNPHPAPTGWLVEPRRTVLEWSWIGPLLSLALLLAPAVLAVLLANSVATRIDPLIQGAVKPMTGAALGVPHPLSDLLAGRYGLLTMGPLLFVWAVPTVVFFALVIGACKVSGLVDRLGIALHPWVSRFGLAGRDLVRVVMGFGCNVPAVVNTRSCSACTRGACVSTIAFGAACSYQFGATLGVFAAAGMPWLVAPYLVVLTLATMIYLLATTSRAQRESARLLAVNGRGFLEWPSPEAVWREAWMTLREFFVKAMPIFIAITLIASLLEWLGIVGALAAVVGPAMGAFNLPADAATPVLLASIRKDGILLLAETGLATTLSPSQVLSSVLLAGLLLPCLVTTLTVAREISWRFAARLLARQVVAACAVVALIAWIGAVVER